MSEGKKKFVIKPFRPNVQMTAKQAENIWKALSAAITEIHNQNASSLSFEELYRNAYNLVLHKHGDRLFEGVRTCVTKHLEGIAEVVAKSTDDSLLSDLDTRWKDHKVTMVMIRDILMYMDRTYVVQNKKTPVYDLGLAIFLKVIARHGQVKERLRGLLLKNTMLERRGQPIDTIEMKHMLDMLVELGVRTVDVYVSDFEVHFLEQTQRFYQQESQEYISTNTCPEYLKKAESRLQQEHARSSLYLHTSTEPKLSGIAETELIKNHAEALIAMENSGAVSMFRDDKIEDLRRMYSLFERVPATLILLRNAMGAFVRHTGTQLVRDQEKQKAAVQFVEKLLQLRDKYDVIVSKAMGGDKNFGKTLKEAFESFINTDTRVASYLAQYIDDMLRKGLRGLSEDEIESRLDKVVVIFRYLQDKDVFENFYKQHLAKRLLHGRSVSDEAERTMIQKLKHECGYQFTSKLEGMFTDMRMSKDTMEGFKKQKLLSERLGVKELNVNVLTAGFWPSQSVSPCQLPPEISACCEVFKGFYLNMHQGRRLTWQTNQGTADLLAKFSHKRHELNVSTYQMCILMLFNETDEMDFHAIKEGTGIQPDHELRRHLISLCTPKFRILQKSSKGKEIGETDKFTFNGNFKCQFHRVRILLVAQKEIIGGSQAIPATVDEDRRHLIEAAIVRVMKARKSLQHNALISEVTKQLSNRFCPNPQQIKRRIESLIEREYVERSRADRRVYNYLA